MCNPKLSIYAARQGMRACNNNNMRNPPYIYFITGLRMLLLLTRHTFNSQLSGLAIIV